MRIASKKQLSSKRIAEHWFPMRFTPNNDGLNDRIIPHTSGIKQLLDFSIYNRYGNCIYHTSTIGEGWDGTYIGHTSEWRGYTSG